MITSVFNDFLGLLRGQGPGKVYIDNAIFALHYRLTTFFLIASAALVSAYSITGDPVNCVYDKDELPAKVINTYCWITKTFTLPDVSGEKHAYPYKDFYQPGLGPHKESDPKIYHSFYQWVPFMLLFQGVLFYVPHWFWETWENKRLDALVQDMKVPLMDPKERTERIKHLVSYLLDTFGTYRDYFVRYCCCELLNVLNVIGNIYLTNRFLNDRFYNFGSRSISYLSGNLDPDEISPLDVVFPKLAKCNFMQYGASGTVQRVDALCVMALNVLNEKIYLVLWFWLIILTVLSIANVIYRVIMMTTINMRVRLVEWSALGKLQDPRTIKQVIKHVKIGDAFLITQLAKNMNVVALRILLSELSDKIDKGFGKQKRYMPGLSRNPSPSASLSPANAPLSPNAPLETLDEVDVTDDGSTIPNVDTLPRKRDRTLPQKFVHGE